MRIILFALIVCLLSSPAFAIVERDVHVLDRLAGEDIVNDLQKVEQRFTTLPTGATTAMFAGDTAIKNAPGFVKSITCYSDAAATAGTIALLDSTAAGTGNTIWSFDVLAVAYTTPFTVPLETPFSVGLYADFTTTADVKCMVQYR